MVQIGLVADDVKAIRQANRFVVRCNADNGTVLECIKERPYVSDPVFAGERELRRVIVCETFNAQGNVATFVSMYPSGAWRVLVQLVKAGDRLQFRARENGNGYTKQAQILRESWKDADDRRHHPDYHGLYCDELLVSMIRPGTSESDRPKVIVNDLLLNYTVCPDNSGRAIKGVTADRYSLA